MITSSITLSSNLHSYYSKLLVESANSKLLLFQNDTRKIEDRTYIDKHAISKVKKDNYTKLIEQYKANIPPTLWERFINFIRRYL